MAEQTVSPMMQQYFEIKKQHPNEIVFYRVGDFYEMFYDDALTASRELELTLTGKNCGKEERAPMCGVPFHSYETYVARLIAKGYKVAICEQMEDPALAKGLVKRDIIRVVTPGTVIESSMLDEDKNNYLCSIYCKRRRGRWKAGVCFADISTGEARATELEAEKLGPAIITELCRFMPSEILICPGILDFKDVTAYIKQHTSALVELREDACYQDALVEATMAGQFGAGWRKAMGYEADCLVPYAVAALLNYLQETQKHGLERIKSVENYADAQYMRLSPVTRANLELTETMRGREKRGTLLWVLDKTETSMGKRLLRAWIEQPLVDADAINARLSAVQALYTANIARADLKEALSHVYDMERLTTRILYGSATPREVKALGDTCARLPQIREQAAACGAPLLEQLAQQIDPLQDLQERIENTLVDDPPATLKDGGAICSGYNSEVDELRDIMHGGKGYLASLESKLREETGIPKLKIGFNKVFGYYIEVSRSYTDSVPDTFTRKQTLTNGERYITPELKELENKILGANERLLALEHQLFAELLSDISAQIVRLQRTALAVAQLDVLAGFAEAALQNNYVMPEVDGSDRMEIKEGRHPVIEQMLKGSLFVPNDTLLDEGENRMLLITGPNMAGKSTYMRQNALIALMAQIGSFVPAASAHIGVVDAIFTRVGASDDLAAGQSTFMVEMTEVAEILRHASKDSLVILDEIGRGTSTFDGMSIARAVVEYICDNIGCKTLFATHYHELTGMEQDIYGVKNYNIAVKKRGEDITFLRRIVAGPADDSYGIEVAKLAGLPASVTKRAHAVLRQLEASAPDHNKPIQLDFETVEAYNNPPVPSEVVEKLHNVDIETLTPLEALNFLYELKNTLDKE
ncbi:MAG TPA: DNA mismatch repair protein MutS [Candidatus Gemmiger avistercoris]|uniref:DNA mismatch repair protein MutS n=1 Tax=Candidatus Gemmiger avistercoris TaxID=2838606 RepID=A0A9D2FJ41_9FIRM|nr:DNA mismatch repair protein MutS [uncultured Subdoligranulum sp.]HIZ61375.1 DNA mismatch repair protein MutS [Candidatus Gemmiger avistercoris]